MMFDNYYTTLLGTQSHCENLDDFGYEKLDDIKMELVSKNVSLLTSFSHLLRNVRRALNSSECTTMND